VTFLADESVDRQIVDRLRQGGHAVRYTGEMGPGISDDRGLEAAQLSGFHPEYVRRLARQGKIGAEKKDRDWWIDRDVLHTCLQTVEELGPQKYDPRGPVMPAERLKSAPEHKDEQGIATRG
jgi:hypothetical protein